MQYSAHAPTPRTLPSAEGIRSHAASAVGTSRCSTIRITRSACSSIRRQSVVGDFPGPGGMAATDGTVRKRFQNDDVADQAFLKTGTLEGVRAIAGYVFAPSGRRFVVVCFVNHRNASRAQPPLDFLVRWVYDNAR